MVIKNEVKEKYEKSRKYFLEILEHAKFITSEISSIDTSKCSKEPDIFGFILFTRIYVFAESISKILPKDIMSDDEYWDYNSIFSLTRNIIDCSETLFYICFDVNSRSNKLLRLAYLSLFELNFWISYYQETGEHKLKKTYIEIKKTALDEIEKSMFFKKLDNREAEIFKKGKSRIFGYYRNSLERKMNYINIKTYKGTYKFFSACTHSFPPSLYPMAFRNHNSKEGMEAEIEYITTALLICSVYCGQSANNLINYVIKRIKFIYEQFSEEEKTKLQKISVRLDKITEICRI